MVSFNRILVFFEKIKGYFLKNLYAKKIEIGRCFIILYWTEMPEFKLIKIDFFDKAKIGLKKDKIFNFCRKENKRIRELGNSIVDYFKKRKPLKFNLQDFDFSGCSKFSKQVLIALTKIPFGKITTYKRLAELAGFPKACRAVGSVMAKNPFPLLIPCHRVIRTDLSIGKFGPGSELKRFLLCHEISEKAFDEHTLKDRKIYNLYKV